MTRRAEVFAPGRLRFFPLVGELCSVEVNSPAVMNLRPLITDVWETEQTNEGALLC